MGKPLLAWERPQLIVLAKSTPEESVLASCKTQNFKVTTSGPANITQQADCAAGADFANCSNCQSRGMGGS